MADNIPRKAGKVIAHLTSAHPRTDTRIFLKQCCSLASAGCTTFLVVADGLPDEHKQGVSILGVPKAGGRWQRILKSPDLVLRRALSLDADIYHLHDPELIPMGLKLKRLGKRVVFDSHEDVPRQMLSKPYLNPLLLKILSRTMSGLERYACSKFDGIVTATPFIGEKFVRINRNTEVINNFPLASELESEVSWDDKRQEVCYVGVISAIRGISQLIEACGLLSSEARLNLAGTFSGANVQAQVKALPGWERVNPLGFVDRARLREILGRSVAGVVTFLPLPNHVDAQPNKMFEYMSAGIPVIGSNFPLWRDIIEVNRCGICVDPLDPRAIAGAIDHLVKNPALAREMGANGRKAVLNHYNWSFEEGKLMKFYEMICETVRR